MRGVDLAIERGEFVAIMGPSGCGKSTLLNLLAGLDRPTAGEVWLDGERIDAAERDRPGAAAPPAGRVRLPVLQPAADPHACGERRAAAALLGRAADAEPGGDARPDCSASSACRARRTRRPWQLSGGEQQRVALARALANKPDLLVADEPTGNLDSAATRDVLGLLGEAHADGQTILLVTHDARVAAAADRVVTMRDGRVVDSSVLAPARPVELPFDIGPA